MSRESRLATAQHLPAACLLCSAVCAPEPVARFASPHHRLAPAFRQLAQPAVAGWQDDLLTHAWAGKHAIGRSSSRPDSTSCDGWISFMDDKSISRNHAVAFSLPPDVLAALL